jgi:hypothetical protein
MQNIGATCMDVANMDEIVIPIDVEIWSCGWPQRNNHTMAINHTILSISIHEFTYGLSWTLWMKNDIIDEIVIDVTNNKCNTWNFTTSITYIFFHEFDVHNC